jgi:hypothetical protein
MYGNITVKSLVALIYTNKKGRKKYRPKIGAQCVLISTGIILQRPELVS